jgi:hypothetical protein
VEGEAEGRAGRVGAVHRLRVVVLRHVVRARVPRARVGDVRRPVVECHVLVRRAAVCVSVPMHQFSEIMNALCVPVAADDDAIVEVPVRSPRIGADVGHNDLVRARFEVVDREEADLEVGGAVPISESVSDRRLAVDRHRVQALRNIRDVNTLAPLARIQETYVVTTLCAINVDACSLEGDAYVRALLYT